MGKYFYMQKVAFDHTDIDLPEIEFKNPNAAK